MGSRSSIGRTLAAIDTAIGELLMGEDTWEAVLRALRQGTKSCNAAYFAMTAEEDGPAPWCLRVAVHDEIDANGTQQLTSLTNEGFDPRLSWWWMNSAAGAIHTDYDCFEDARYDRDPLLAEIAREFGTGFGSYGTLAMNPTTAAGIVLHKAHRSGQHDEDDHRVLRAALPAVARASAMFLHMQEERASAKASGLLEITDRGVLVLDRKGCIVTSNETGLDVTTSSDGIDIVGGALHVADPVARAALERAIGVTVAGGVCAHVSIARPSGKAPYSVQLVPLSGDFSWGRPAAAVVITDPANHVRHAAVSAELVGADITPAEARICAVLFEGRSPADAARQIGVSINTVRTQLKSIFSKLGVRGQTELALKLTSMGYRTER